MLGICTLIIVFAIIAVQCWTLALLPRDWRVWLVTADAAQVRQDVSAYWLRCLARKLSQYLPEREVIVMCHPEPPKPTKPTKSTRWRTAKRRCETRPICMDETTEIVTAQVVQSVPTKACPIVNRVSDYLRTEMLTTSYELPAQRERKQPAAATVADDMLRVTGTKPKQEPVKERKLDAATMALSDADLVSMLKALGCKIPSAAPLATYRERLLDAVEGALHRPTKKVAL